jgi:hypothetical protein
VRIKEEGEKGRGGERKMDWGPSPTPQSFDLFLFNIVNVMIG